MSTSMLYLLVVGNRPHQPAEVTVITRRGNGDLRSAVLAGRESLRMTGECFEGEERTSAFPTIIASDSIEVGRWSKVTMASSHQPSKTHPQMERVTVSYFRDWRGKSRSTFGDPQPFILDVSLCRPFPGDTDKGHRVHRTDATVRSVRKEWQRDQHRDGRLAPYSLV